MRSLVAVGPVLVAPDDVVAISSDAAAVGLHLRHGGIVRFVDAALADDLDEVARLLGAAVLRR